MSEFIIKKQIQHIENALYVIATPIGNLSDITIRALQILSSVDLILCEDTRVAGVLLKNFEITSKKLMVYNDQSNETIRNKILKKLHEGNSLALISDAGTPLISDPGYKLVNFLRQEKQKIICIPGPSSLTASLSISGIACDNFLFLGFLPSSRIAKENKLKNLPTEYSYLFFETSNRIIETLQVLKKFFFNRKVCIARELTKIFEEVIIGNPAELMDIINQNSEKIRGEFVVIVEKISKDDVNFDLNDINKEINSILKSKKSVKETVSELVERYKINKKEAYSLVLKHQFQTKLNNEKK